MSGNEIRRIPPPWTPTPSCRDATSAAMLDNRHHLLPAHARAAAHLAARHVGIGARRRRKPAAVRDAIASAGSLAWS